jgi:hypothetical protein
VSNRRVDQGFIVNVMEQLLKVTTDILGLLVLVRVISIELVCDCPHFADIMAQLECVGVLLLSEILFNTIQIDEIFGKFIEFWMVGIQRFLKELGCLMTVQHFEHIFTFLPCFLGSLSHSLFLLTAPGIDIIIETL